jgi:AcrR family transcriptional regulator
VAGDPAAIVRCPRSWRPCIGRSVPPSQRFGLDAGHVNAPPPRFTSDGGRGESRRGLEDPSRPLLRSRRHYADRVEKRIAGPTRPSAGRAESRTAAADAGASSRDRILAAATDLFVHRGYEKTTVDEIGAASGVTGPAIYRHFDGKAQLLDAVIASVLSPTLQATADVVAREIEPLRALREMIAIWVDAAFQTTILTLTYTHQYPNLDRITRERIRIRHRAVTDMWMVVLARLRPALPAAERLAMVDSAFWLIGSQAFYRSPLPTEIRARRLRKMVLGAMLADEDPRDEPQDSI